MFSDWFRRWGPEAILLLATTAAGLWAAGRWIDPFSDEGFSWSLLYRLRDGERLYRDICLQYTPLSPYLLAAGARIFGASSRYLLLVNWVPAILVGLLLLRCARPLLSTIERLALTGVLVSSSLFAPGMGRLVFPYYPGVVHALLFSLGALWLLQRNTERPERWAFWGGVLAGIAFCCKQEIGVAALLGLGAVVLARPARPFVWCARLSVGFLTAILPAVIFMLSSASVASLRTESHFWPLAFSPPASAKYLMRIAMGIQSPNWPSMLLGAAFGLLWRILLVSAMALLIARERRRSRWLRVLALLGAVVVWGFWEGFSLLQPISPGSLTMSVAFLVALVALGMPSLPDRAFLVALGIFAGLVGVRTAFSPTLGGHYDGPGHLVSGLTWVVFLCILLPRLLLGEGRSASSLRALMAILLCAVSWWSAVEGIESLRYPKRVGVRTPEGTVFVEREQAAFLEAIGRNSTAGQRALILPQTNGVDVLFHLISASPVIDPLPPWLDVGLERRIIARLEKSPPDLIVLFERPVREYGSKPFGQGYGLLLSEWCFRNYRVVEASAAGKILHPRTAAEAKGGPGGHRIAVYNLLP